MSNKRNKRRKGQRVRSEIDRKPVVVTKAKSTFIALQPSERKRKAERRYFKKPTKDERREREMGRRRWLFTGKPKRKWRGRARWTWEDHQARAAK